MALAKMVAEDPSFTRLTPTRSRARRIMKGMGELHLDIKVDILKRTYKVEANIGAPQVAYRESLGQGTDIDYTHKKQTGGTGQFARVKIKFEPGEPGSGFVFESTIVGGIVPKEFIPGVEKGIESAKDNGLLAGFPVIDFKATLYRRRLPRRGLLGPGLRNRQPRGVPRTAREGRAQAARADHEGRGGDAGRVHRRRHRRPELAGAARSRARRPRGNAQVVTAFVPLANMFGYINTLRVMQPGPRRSSRCSTTTTSRCRKPSPTK